MSTPSSSQNPPPPPSPILTAYENFQNDTPLITRYILITYTISCLLSNLLLPQSTLYVLLNIPYFTIFHYELYRVVTTLVVCTSFLNLIFGWIVLLRSGRRIEQSVGSTTYGVLAVGCFGILSQLVFTLCVWVVYFLSGHSSVEVEVDGGAEGVEGGAEGGSISSPASAMTTMMVHKSDGGGLWILIFGLLALECAHDHRLNSASTRRLFLSEVPTLYYPLILLVLFTLFDLSGSGSSSSSNILLSHVPEMTSLGIGYAIGLRKLDLEQIMSSERRKRVEETFVRPLTIRVGWVVGPASSDITLIPQSDLSQSYSSFGASSTSANTNANANATSSNIAGFGRRSNDVEQGWRPASATNINSGTSGRTLGSGLPTRRSNGTAASSSGPPAFDQHQHQQRGREALLAAAEQRAKNIEKK